MQIVSAESWDCAIKFGADYTSSYCLSCCLSFRLIMMFRLHTGAGLSRCCGEWVPIQSVGEENEYRHLFLCLEQYRTTDNCPSFWCKDFFMTFLNCRFILMSVFNWTLQSVPSQSNNMGQIWHCWCLNHRVRRCWVCLCWIASMCI